MSKYGANVSGLTKRDALPDVSSILNHPYDGSYLMTGFVIPDTSNMTAPAVDPKNLSNSDKSKRVVWLWWTFAAIKLAFTGLGLLGTVYSCNNCSQGGSQWYDKVGCVVGVVSITVLIGATGRKYGLEYEIIRQQVPQAHPWLTNINDAWNAKRSITAESYMGNLTMVTSAFANITGMPTATLVRSDMNIAENDQTGYPIHVVLTPDDRWMHISAMAINSTGWTFRMTDPAMYNTSLVKKSEDFNMENFSSGGIEASIDYEEPEHAQLSSQYDWTQMTDQVSCYLGDMSGNAYQYQVFDNNHHETMSAGVIRAFSDEPFDQFTLDPSYVSWPVDVREECNIP